MFLAAGKDQTRCQYTGYQQATFFCWKNTVGTSFIKLLLIWWL